MTYCTNCGTPREPSHRFCAGCAEPVSAAPATPIAILEQGEDDGWVTDPPARPHPRGALVIALAALVLLLGGIGVTTWSILAQDTDTAALPLLSLTPPPNPSPAETSTSQAAGPSSAVDPEDAALDQLAQQIARDRPRVQSELAEAWA